MDKKIITKWKNALSKDYKFTQITDEIENKFDKFHNLNGN